MIDTVRFMLDNPLRVVKTPKKWKKQAGVSLPDEGNPVNWFVFQQDKSDLRIGGQEGYASWLEVSLPKLLYGSNGKLLRASEVATAYDCLLDTAGSIVENPSFSKMTRVDLAHHFQGYAWEMIPSLRGLTHRRVRRKGVEFFGSSLEWPGKDIRIRLYDKRLEVEKQHGNLMRLEFQVRGKALDGCRDGIWTPDKGFDVQGCYRAYKGLCGGFDYRPVPRLSSVVDLLVCLRENKVLVGGMDPVELFLNSKSQRTRYRYESDMKLVKLDYFEANFSAFLPDDLSDLVYHDCLKAA